MDIPRFCLRFSRRVHLDQEGFTLVEMMIALAILFIVMSSVVYTATTAFKYAGVARQRETGMGYAVKYYQEALALPFQAIKAGLNPVSDSTYATDTNIITASATCKTTLANAPCVKVPGISNYESLVVKSGTGENPCGGSGSPPLCPHIVTETPPTGSSGTGTTYTSKVYVTTPSTAVCSSCYRLVVNTSWNRSVVQGTLSSVTYQSLMTFTGGSGACLSTSSHPFAGPCGKYQYGQALIPQGTITITGNTSGGTSIQNINLGSAVVTLPQNSANSQSSQVGVVQAIATSSGTSLSLGTSAATTIGQKYLSAQADNDPTLPSITSQQSTLSGTPDSSGSLSAQAGSSSVGSTSASGCGSTSGNAICLTKTSNDLTGSATAAVAASASPSCNSITNSLPCGYATSQTQASSACTGTMARCVVLHLFNGGTDLGTCTLVSVGAPSTASSAQVSQNTTTTPEPQTAKVSRTFGQITFGCIPSNVATAPTSWNVLPTGFTPVGTTNTGFLAGIKTGYTMSQQAQAGIASPTTSTTVSGTEWYYSPGTMTQTGGTLNATVPGTSDTLTSIGTLSANLAIAQGGAGTLASALANTTDIFSTLGSAKGAINSVSSTSITVTETTAPPTVPFTIKIDSEQMRVTARSQSNANGSTCKNGTSDYCYTVARGYNGTTAATHTNGTQVLYVSTAGCPSPCTFNVTETRAPSTGTPFTIQVDSEKMQVTSRTLVSGSTYAYTVTRATSGTTPAAHSSGAAFSEVVTTCPTSCSFDVSESSTPPATPFVVQIDSEQMLVTARAKYWPSGAIAGCINSNSLWCYTVTRGYNSTTATTHAANATVNLVTMGCPTTCSFNVTETTSPPSSVPFTIQVESEQMQVTGRTLVSGSTYTYGASRAYNATTAASHASGTTFSYLSFPFGYAALTDSSANGATIPVTSVNHTTGGCTYQESVNGTLKTPTGSVANTTTSGIVTNSAGTLTGPLTGDFKFNVTCGATVIADLDIAFDLGTVATTATYSPAAA